MLGRWAQAKAMEATLIQRVTRGNPPLPESNGGSLE